MKTMILATGVVLALAAAAGSAQAGTGCNNVVNPLVWGCAPWDNNNGPQFPYYKKQVIQIPAGQVKLESRNGAQMALYNGNYYPLVASGAGNLVASGAGNISVYSK